jgi:hypothetical protein
MRRYVHGPGMDAPLVRYDYDGAGALEGRRWLLADERGSIYAHADEAGVIIQINTYDEYGRPGDSNQGRFGYTGQIWLAEAGSITTRPAPITPSWGSSCSPTRSGIAGASISTPMWAGIR